MHKFFANKKFVIVIICIIIALVAITGTVAIRNNKKAPTVVQRGGNDIVGFANELVAVPANGISGFFASTGNLFNTYKENNRLMAKIDSLKATQAHTAAVENENSQLRKQLHLNQTMTNYKSIAASVIARTPSTWQKQIIINKGSKAGIEKNMCVVVNSGLIGRVIEVNGYNSKVELVTDSSGDASRFSVAVEGGQNADGLLQGYNKNNNQLEMGSITGNAKVKKGQKVITNGLGGVTPKGILVGQVAGVTKNNGGISEKINITPAGNLQDLEVVRVLGQKK